MARVLGGEKTWGWQLAWNSLTSKESKGNYTEDVWAGDNGQIAKFKWTGIIKGILKMAY